MRAAQASRYRIAVCDNDREVREDIVRLIRAKRPEAEVYAFASGEALLGAGQHFSLCFLDIKGAAGMEAARTLRQREARSGGRSVIIFVTGYREYMEQAFDVQAFHYLLKPIDRAKFARVLERAWEEAAAARAREDAYLVLKVAEMQRKVYLRDIFFLESNNKKVSVHTEEGTYETYGTMDAFERTLGEGFCRCHRCYLVNFAKVTAYGPDGVRLANGETILLARKKYAAFVKAYLRYASGGGIVHV